MTVVDDIKRDYPDIWWLFSDPEVGPLLRDAVDPNKGMDQTTFKAKFYQTNYFKHRSVAQRQWDILSHTDPTEANARRAQYRSQLQQTAIRLGINLNNPQLNWMTELGVQRNLDPTGQQVIGGLIHFANGSPNSRIGAGSIRTATNDVMQMANGQFFKNVSAAGAQKWGEQIAMGQRTIQDFQEELTKDAIKRMPWMADELKGGNTVADVINPLRQVVASELELPSLSAVDVMNNPTWKKLIGFHDPATNKTRLMTESEATVLARQQPQWWNTAKGQQTDSDETLKMLNIFGYRKSA